MKSQKSSPESLYDCMITESPKYKIISKMNIADDSIKENLPALTHNLSQVIVSKLSYWNKVYIAKNIFICGISAKNTFVLYAVLYIMITKPKRREPKLKNFTAVVPAFVDFIIVVKNTQAENKQKEYKPITINIKISRPLRCI